MITALCIAIFFCLVVSIVCVHLIREHRRGVSALHSVIDAHRTAIWDLVSGVNIAEDHEKLRIIGKMWKAIKKYNEPAGDNIAQYRIRRDMFNKIEEALK